MDCFLKRKSISYRSCLKLGNFIFITEKSMASMFAI